jgi:hypothetical protein
VADFSYLKDDDNEGREERARWRGGGEVQSSTITNNMIII